jgi:hypothetical protein
MALHRDFFQNTIWGSECDCAVTMICFVINDTGVVNLNTEQGRKRMQSWWHLNPTFPLAAPLGLLPSKQHKPEDVAWHKKNRVTSGSNTLRKDAGVGAGYKRIHFHVPTSSYPYPPPYPPPSKTATATR